MNAFGKSRLQISFFLLGSALATLVVCFAFVALIEVWQARQQTPRLAADSMVINVIALIVLYGAEQASALYFEAALLFAMFGFVSTVAYCKFIRRGDIIE